MSRSEAIIGHNISTLKSLLRIEPSWKESARNNQLHRPDFEPTITVVLDEDGKVLDESDPRDKTGLLAVSFTAEYDRDTSIDGGTLDNVRDIRDIKPERMGSRGGIDLTTFADDKDIPFEFIRAYNAVKKYVKSK